ncbi:MAG: class I SAM-dependent methyltransferase [Thermodesulfobacteria bacterium]|nr:class I SAM-dependent methyltransferase [Thermodesulfobacteriota bacterium]
MATKEEIERYQRRYETGDTPWDSGRPDKNLVNFLKTAQLSGKKALEIGCGTGENAIFLAQNGFDVTATEIVPLALDKAREKAEKQGVSINFLVKDIMDEDIPGKPFDFAFDRGCFHHYKTPEERLKFARRLAQHLGDRGIWLCLAGNSDGEKVHGQGPPKRTAQEMVAAVEPFFEILLLKSGEFDSNMTPPPRCWIMVARKRKSGPQK